MLLPYLTGHLTGRLGLSVTAAALVLGVALLTWRFEAVCLAAATVFFLLFLLQWRYLPPQHGSEQGRNASWRQDWRQPVANGPFRRFTLAMMAYYLCFNQIYLTLPLALLGVLGNTLAGWLWQQAPTLACWSLAGLTALATLLAWGSLGRAAQPLRPADQPT